MTNNKYDKLMIEALKRYKDTQLSSVTAENDIQYEFTQNFNRKMNKLIERQEKRNNIIFNNTAKKAATIILAIVMGLSLTLSIEAIREPIFKFFYEVFFNRTEINYNVDNDDTITTYYTLPIIPEGYVKTTDTFINELSTNICWINENNITINFKQSIENIDSSIDSEDSNIMEVTVNNTNTLYCNNGHSIICAWSEYGYYFELIYPSELGEKYMYNIIGKLEEIKA